MTKTNHTPGPWVLDEYKEGLYFDVRRRWDSNVTPGNSDTYGSGEGAHITGISYGGPGAVPTRAQAEANGRLIAAAPDLLAALERIAVWDFNILGDCVAEAQAMAQAVIKKAKGER